MERFKSLRRVQVRSEETLNLDDDGNDEPIRNGSEEQGDDQPRSGGDSKPFMGMKVRRRASIYKDCVNGDYIGVDSDPYLIKILSKHGDSTVVFADKVLKFTGSGKMKRRILIITDFAIYLFDPESDSLKRRIALAAVDKMYLSELSDNFFAIIIPTEYDLLIASTRKKEIVSTLVAVTKSTSVEIEVVHSNRFDYNAAADLVKEVQFEEVDGGIKTRISKKES